MLATQHNGLPFNPLTGRMRRVAGAAALLAVAAALAWLPLRDAALVAGGAAGALLVVRRPWLLWAAMGALLSFAAAFKIGPTSVLDLLLGAAIALWFADGVRRNDLRIAAGAPLPAAMLYVLLLFVSALRALDFGQALAEVVKWAEFAVVLALLPVVLRAPAAGAGEIAPQRAAGRVRWVVAGVVAGAAAQGLLGLYQFAFRVGPEWFALPGGFVRAAGTFGQPNPFAGWLGLVLPVAVSLALWAWAEAWRIRRHAGDRLPALLWALAWSSGAALIGGGLLASWSRGAWLGAAAALGAVVVLRSRRAALLAALAGFLLVGALLIGALSPALAEQYVPEPVRVRLAEIPAFFGADDPLAQKVTDENFAVIERVAHWVAALRMVEQAPWMGVGAGSYAAAYPAVRIARWEEALGHAHNAYLNTLAEVGIVGAAVVVLLWGTLTVWLVRALRHAARESTQARADDVAARDARQQRALVVGALAVLVHLAVHSMVDNLFVQGIYLTLALWPALVAVRFLPSFVHASSQRRRTTQSGIAS